MHEASRLLAVSQATRHAILEHAPWYASKIRVVYNGIDRQRIYPLEKEVAYRLLAPLVAPGTPFVLTVGQGAPYKNHGNAVRGFLEAFGHRPEYRMILVRRALRRDRALDALLHSPQGQAQVLTLPYVTAEVLNALYNTARIVLHPSYYEGFGLPLLEAMATAVPIVTADVIATRGREFYCETQTKEGGDRAWCGATCSRTAGASLATAGYQAHGKPMRP